MTTTVPGHADLATAGSAFERSVLRMGALLLLVAALTRLMPGPQRSA